jgi:hypothetical protein
MMYMAVAPPAPHSQQHRGRNCNNHGRGCGQPQQWQPRPPYNQLPPAPPAACYQTPYQPPPAPYNQPPTAPYNGPPAQYQPPAQHGRFPNNRPSGFVPNNMPAIMGPPMTGYPPYGQAAQNPNAKRYNNQNDCWMHGGDIDDHHMGQTCQRPAPYHQPQATRTNQMGGSQRNLRQIWYGPAS